MGHFLMNTHTFININGSSLSTIENQALRTDSYEYLMGLVNRKILAIRIRKLVI